MIQIEVNQTEFHRIKQANPTMFFTDFDGCKFIALGNVLIKKRIEANEQEQE